MLHFALPFRVKGEPAAGLEPARNAHDLPIYSDFTNSLICCAQGKRGSFRGSGRYTLVHSFRKNTVQLYE